MNEGDIAIVFSQFGEVTDVRLARDQTTGKPGGFCYLAYEDWRSTILAVDGLNGQEICGRRVTVDHLKEIEKVLRLADEDELPYKASGPDGKGWGQFRKQKK